jgi:hypothetical protein
VTFASNAPTIRQDENRVRDENRGFAIRGRKSKNAVGG